MIQLRCASPFQTGTSRTPFWICNYQRAIPLEYIRQSVCPGFSCSATAHDKDVQVPFMAVTVKPHAEILCKQDIVGIRLLLVLFTQLRGIPPFGRSVFLTPAVIPPVGIIDADSKGIQKGADQDGLHSIFCIVQRQGMIQLLRQGFHHLKKVPSGDDGICDQCRRPPYKRQSGKPDNPL